MRKYELHGQGATESGEDFDLICGDIRIELDRRRDGRWTFWNVVLPGGERFGGRSTLGPGAAEWLDAVQRERADKRGAAVTDGC